MTPLLSRRSALGLLAGAGVAIGGGVVLVGRDDDPAPAPPPTSAARRSSPEDVALIGERYLVGRPEEASVEALSAAVDLPGGGTEDFAALRRRIHREFDAGEVARVDGWVLALTEARLCALVFLAS